MATGFIPPTNSSETSDPDFELDEKFDTCDGLPTSPNETFSLENEGHQNPLEQKSADNSLQLLNSFSPFEISTLNKSSKFSVSSQNETPENIRKTLGKIRRKFLKSSIFTNTTTTTTPDSSIKYSDDFVENEIFDFEVDVTADELLGKTFVKDMPTLKAESEPRLDLLTPDQFEELASEALLFIKRLSFASEVEINDAGIAVTTDANETLTKAHPASTSEAKNATFFIEPHEDDKENCLGVANDAVNMRHDGSKNRLAFLSGKRYDLATRLVDKDVHQVTNNVKPKKDIEIPSEDDVLASIAEKLNDMQKVGDRLFSGECDEHLKQQNEAVNSVNSSNMTHQMCLMSGSHSNDQAEIQDPKSNVFSKTFSKDKLQKLMVGYGDVKMIKEATLEELEGTNQGSTSSEIGNKLNNTFEISNEKADVNACSSSHENDDNGSDDNTGDDVEDKDHLKQNVKQRLSTTFTAEIIEQAYFHSSESDENHANKLGSMVLDEESNLQNVINDDNAIEFLPHDSSSDTRSRTPTKADKSELLESRVNANLTIVKRKSYVKRPMPNLNETIKIKCDTPKARSRFSTEPSQLNVTIDIAMDINSPSPSSGGKRKNTFGSSMIRRPSIACGKTRPGAKHTSPQAGRTSLDPNVSFTIAKGNSETPLEASPANKTKKKLNRSFTISPKKEKRETAESNEKQSPLSSSSNVSGNPHPVAVMRKKTFTISESNDGEAQDQTFTQTGSSNEDAVENTLSQPETREWKRNASFTITKVDSNSVESTAESPELLRVPVVSLESSDATVNKPLKRNGSFVISRSSPQASRNKQNQDSMVAESRKIAQLSNESCSTQRRGLKPPSRSSVIPSTVQASLKPKLPLTPKRMSLETTFVQKQVSRTNTNASTAAFNKTFKEPQNTTKTRSFGLPKIPQPNSQKIGHIPKPQLPLQKGTSIHTAARYEASTRTLNSTISVRTDSSVKPKMPIKGVQSKIQKPAIPAPGYNQQKDIKALKDQRVNATQRGLPKPSCLPGRRSMQVGLKPSQYGEVFGNQPKMTDTRAREILSPSGNMRDFPPQCTSTPNPSRLNRSFCSLTPRSNGLMKIKE